MEIKEIASEVLKNSVEVQTEVKQLKVNVEALLIKYLKRIKDITGEIPNEEQFIKVLSILLDEAIKLPQPYESVDGFVIEFALKMIDKYFLDKYLGKDWFERMKAMVGNI